MSSSLSYKNAKASKKKGVNPLSENTFEYEVRPNKSCNNSIHLSTRVAALITQQNVTTLFTLVQE